MHEPQMSAKRLYLLDVEGTVAPISLVSEQLFPYARAHFAAFLQAHGNDAAVQSDLALLAEENGAETDPHAPRISRLEPSQELRAPSFPPGSAEGIGDREAAFAYLLWLMDRDRKSTALKSLQGKIWKAGFESGQLKGTLFADVPAAFARWHKAGKVAIYSSGSVEAQQLLFRHSIFGDLTGLIAGYFDTRAGAKTSSKSYSAIAAAMDAEPHKVCFFSDVVRELDAARDAGCETRLVIREGNMAVEDAHGHAAIESFARVS